MLGEIAGTRAYDLADRSHLMGNHRIIRQGPYPDTQIDVFFQQIHDVIGQNELNVDVTMDLHKVIYSRQHMKTAE